MAQLIDSVVAHREVWQALLRQLREGKLAHALAFTGAAGVGQKPMAWAMAQALVCESEPQSVPCGHCGPCRRVESQQSESVLFVEPTSGVIKLEAAQQILHFLNLQRLGRARVIIIDQAQKLNPQAGNSLLKIIEEPPPQTFFILVMGEFSQLLPTLRSRVQVIRFSPLTQAELEQMLKQDLSVNDKPAAWMLRSSRGSLEQLEAFRDSHTTELRTVTLGFLQQALSGRRDGLQALLDQGKDRESALAIAHLLQQLLRDWCVMGQSELIHSDLASTLAALPQPNPTQRVELWRSAFQLEMDLNAHVDKSLLFENFFYRAKSSVTI